jgi:hypothetical protein
MTDTVIDGINYGPLALLIGVWEGDKGVDKAPEPDGEERSLFYETILFEAIGDVTNAEEQTLAVLRYHQVVRRKSNDKVFHNETGYWSWDARTGEVVQSFSIPRGVALVAGGKAGSDPANPAATVIEVQAAAGDADWGIAQAPFMRDKARTVSFKHKITVEGDSMQYSESTLLDIYGRAYDHTDINRLKRTKQG